MLGHLALALAMQLAIALPTRNWWAGAAAASAWAIAREITQAEYRWIERFGEGLRANMPWWGGFDARVWTTADQWLDWTVPTAAVIAVAWLVGRRPQAAARRSA